MSPLRYRVVIAAMAALVVGLVPADVGAQTTEELKRLTLEELLSINVTTVSREPEATSGVPAAIHVITQDDIRRSEATSLSEVLRLAPGMQVARINAGTFSIGTRGFADRLSRSMLVLIDGRAVYSPLFAGTYWEVQDMLLDDIDRIEVIRGPGGTLWGANAVNGIINIITKTAAQTSGILAKAHTGTTERAGGGFRYGAPIGKAWNYRVYAKAVDRTHQLPASGQAFDGFRMAQGGFRADWTPSAARTVTIQGDLYRASLGERQTITTYESPFTHTRDVDAPLSGGDLLARWSGALGQRATFSTQLSYTTTNREELPVSEERDTVDLDFQSALAPWGRHAFIWGAGYRVSTGLVTAVPPTAFSPPRRTDDILSAFAQDEITLVKDRWRVSIGSKFEHNDYTGLELQPSARLWWTPSDTRTVWWSVTRAVRTPSRVETDYTTISLLNQSIPLFVRLEPFPSFTSEKLIAYESGLRVRPLSKLYLTFSGFYNVHDDVLSTEIGAPAPEPTATPVRLVIPIFFGNGLDGNSYGGEVTSDIRPLAWWRWTVNYSYLRILMARQPGSLDGSQERRNEGLSPRHQLQVTSSIDMPHRFSLDAFVRYVSELPAGPVPAYLTSNLRFGWEVTPEFDLAIIGQELNQPSHLEWVSSPNIEIRRSVRVSLTWQR